MANYKKTFKIAEIVGGVAGQVKLEYGEYDSEAAAEAYLGTIDPVERAAKYYVILPVYVFPAKN